jgi:hypothetical protein
MLTVTCWRTPHEGWHAVCGVGRCLHADRPYQQGAGSARSARGSAAHRTLFTPSTVEPYNDIYT